MKKIILITAIVLNSFFGMDHIYGQSNPVGAVFAREGGATPAGVFKFSTGGYEVFTIVSADKEFQPASLYYGKDNTDKQKVDAMVPSGKVPTSMNCFLVKTPAGYIMIDTGLPEAKGGKTAERMKSVNIAPEEIKAIYLTHGHFDHIGGLLDETGKAVYPKAKVYISNSELDFIRKTMFEATRQIEEAYKDRLVSFNAGDVLPDNVVPIDAKGHTPGHTAYQLGNLLFVGDLVHGPEIQLIDPTICAGYDADRSEAIANRNKLLAYAVKNSLTVLGAHVPYNGVLF